MSSVWERLKRLDEAYLERTSRPPKSSLDRWHVRHPVLGSAVVASPLWLLLPLIQIVFLHGPVLMWISFSLVGVLTGWIQYTRAVSKRERLYGSDL